MTDRETANIFFEPILPYLVRLVEYKVTNGMGYADSFYWLYHPPAELIDDQRSLQIHLRLMDVRALQIKRDLKIR